MKALSFLILMVFVVAEVSAAGFGLYEASARGDAMGGAVIGDPKDASANYYNPAAMTDSTNFQFLAGAVFLNPFCDVEVDHHHDHMMNGGWFPPLHAYMTIPLPYDFAFGFGMYNEYGLGTHYKGDWVLAHDSIQTKLEQFTFNPNIAYKITDSWSVSAGARMSHITFMRRSHPGAPYYSKLNLQNKIDADDWDCGWEVATRYKITEKLKAGIVYRSAIDHKLKGHAKSQGTVMTPYGPLPVGSLGALSPAYAGLADQTGNAKVRLPPSIALGLNYDFTERFRCGYAMTWTRWSTFDDIDFNGIMEPTLNPKTQSIELKQKNVHLNWHDVFRFGWGFEYDINDWLQGRISYMYDMDPSGESGTTMLPYGHRHIPGFGFGFKLPYDVKFDVGYSLIMMHSATRYIEDGAGQTHRFQTRNAMSHEIGMSLSYEF